MEDFASQSLLSTTDKLGYILFKLKPIFSNILFCIGIAFALDVLGLASFIGYVFSAIILLIIIGSFLVASKDFLPNIIAGIMIYRKKLFTVNETIEIDFCEGKVISFNLFETKLKTKSGDIIHIPNSFITQKKLVLY